MSNDTLPDGWTSKSIGNGYIVTHEDNTTFIVEDANDILTVINQLTRK